METIKKEIGGYFELEELSGEEYHDGLLRFNLGRTALIYLLEARGCRSLMVPHFLCDSVLDRCREAGIALTFYPVDEDLTPQLPREPEQEEYLLLVNYYGQLTDRMIEEYHLKYKRIIVDHTHSFFQRPLRGVDTLYSCRKFFGLPDGAYLAAACKALPALERDVSNGRMGHILGRYEEGAGIYYKEMLKNAAAFHREPVKGMSKLTQNLLKGIDYESALRKRNENYLWLSEGLNQYNGITWSRPEGPLAYPFYTEHGSKLRSRLAEEGIFVPVYWRNVIEDMPPDSVEHRYASNILPLPCDQRYGKEEMDFIAGTLVRLLQEEGLNKTE